MSTGLADHRPALREEAFDLFVAGYSRRRLCAELRASYGSAAPSESAVGNWSRRDRWMERRARIRQLLRARADTLRARAALERVIARHEDREAEHTFQEQVRSARALYTFLEAGEPAGPDDRPADPLPEVTLLR